MPAARGRRSRPSSTGVEVGPTPIDLVDPTASARAPALNEVLNTLPIRSRRANRRWSTDGGSISHIIELRYSVIHSGQGALWQRRRQRLLVYTTRTGELRLGDLTAGKCCAEVEQILNTNPNIPSRGESSTRADSVGPITARAG